MHWGQGTFGIGLDPEGTGGRRRRLVRRDDEGHPLILMQCGICGETPGSGSKGRRKNAMECKKTPGSGSKGRRKNAMECRETPGSGSKGRRKNAMECRKTPNVKKTRPGALTCGWRVNLLGNARNTFARLHAARGTYCNTFARERPWNQRRAWHPPAEYSRN